MKKIIFIAMFMLAARGAFAQADRREVRRGNREYAKGDYPAADISYRRALMADSLSFAAGYNLASTLYREGDMDGAGKQMDRLEESAGSWDRASDYYFNVGDIALQQKDWKAAVDAFHESLLRNPGDTGAKENYVYARKMLENEQNQGGQDDRDQNQDNQEQNQDDKDQNQNQDEDKQGQEQEQPAGGELTAQQARQMLQAIQAREQETQDKVNREKAAVLKSKQKEKNW